MQSTWLGAGVGVGLGFGFGFGFGLGFGLGLRVMRVAAHVAAVDEALGLDVAVVTLAYHLRAALA